ncbi:hypothetical protein [Methylobacterium sp. E-066]|uniref:hypothetical protein n=1 Tax=Methylobacterium sp. E-066 TaxID=2836584 RepID=UPI001FB9B252|nr:hypothetical protein [Methylobacterium sp. E-066]MCJ2140349.1 hypothetical protein [Methylobacterium sp. E-066]
MKRLLDLFTGAGSAANRTIIPSSAAPAGTPNRGCMLKGMRLVDRPSTMPNGCQVKHLDRCIDEAIINRHFDRRVDIRSRIQHVCSDVKVARSTPRVATYNQRQPQKLKRS